MTTVALINIFINKMFVPMKYLWLKGQHECKFFQKIGFFGLKFSLNLLKYEAKGFIHEKKIFLFNFAFFLRRVGRLSHTATCAMNTT